LSLAPSQLRDLTDEQLAARAQARCASSFEELVRRYQVPLLRFVAERVHCSADAEDVVQETFVRAYTRIDRYRDAWRFSTWLFTIAHRLAVSHLRSRHTRKNQNSMESAGDIAASAHSEPGRGLADRESRNRFWDTAAAVLSEEQLAAVWLYYVDGLGAKEVATVLDRSWVSVKTMLFRARRKLEASAVQLEGAPSRARPQVPMNASAALAAR
jgi:RNA polymerase sigma-70 factor (ECF subfamily)